jgi:hypothetical protein
MTGPTPTSRNSPLPSVARNAAGRTLLGLFQGLAVTGDDTPTGDWKDLSPADRDTWETLGAQLVEVALAAIDPSLLRTDHCLIVSEETWALQHPLSCRPDMHKCTLNEQILADEAVVWRLGPGGYLAAVDAAGKLTVA